MARYKYHGPVQTITLATGKKKDADGNVVSEFKEFSFVPGTETPDLPDSNPMIASMADAGLLVAVVTTTKPASGQKAEK